MCRIVLVALVSASLSCGSSPELDCDEPYSLSITRPLEEGEGATLDAFAPELEDPSLYESAPRLIEIRGCGLDGDVALASSTAIVQAGEALATEGLAIIPVRIPIDIGRDREESVGVTLTIDDDPVATASLPVTFLPELENPSPGELQSGDYSAVRLGDLTAPAGETGIRIASRSAAIIDGEVDFRGRETIGTAGGFDGGNATLDGLGPGGGLSGQGSGANADSCVGSGAGHASAGATGAASAGDLAGGDEYSEPSLLGADRLIGGSGGGGCLYDDFGTPRTIAGGGGGGVFDLSAAGYLVVATIDGTANFLANGGAGTGSGSGSGSSSIGPGGGAGGTLLIRALGLDGRINYTVAGGSRSGGVEGAPGRVRFDLPDVQPCGSPRTGQVCPLVEAGSVYQGARIVRPAQNLIAADRVLIGVTRGTGSYLAEIDGQPAQVSGDRIDVVGEGLHQVCVINLPDDATALADPEWRRRATDCIEVGLVVN